MTLLLIMILSERGCSGLKRWCDSNEAVSRQPPSGFVLMPADVILRSHIDRYMILINLAEVGKNAA